QAAGAEEGEGEEGHDIGGGGERDDVTGTRAAVMPCPSVRDSGHDRNGDEAEQADPDPVPADQEAVDAANGGGDQGRRQALEQADEGHRRRAGIDVDTGSDLDARDHGGHREGTEAETMEEGAQ